MIVLLVSVCYDAWQRVQCTRSSRPRVPVSCLYSPSAPADNCCDTVEQMTITFPSIGFRACCGTPVAERDFLATQGYPSRQVLTLRIPVVSMSGPKL